MQENTTPSSEPLADACPAWADALIRQIHLLEVRLGNLLDPAEAWKTKDVDDVLAKMMQEGADDGDEEGQVEALFRRVTRGLSSEGHDARTIATWINARVGFGGRLPYCDESEVSESLRDIP